MVKQPAPGTSKSSSICKTARTLLHLLLVKGFSFRIPFGGSLGYWLPIVVIQT